VLISDCLSNIPMFIMGSYLLQDGIHEKLDMVGTRFFGLKSRESKNNIWLGGKPFALPRRLEDLGSYAPNYELVPYREMGMQNPHKAW
jgi:hypothetical protein